jgi:anhydro-N-acetylmuramic acid kinase
MSQPVKQPPERPAIPRIVLGAMSGTSADGVDVAAAEITGRGLEMKAKYLGHVEHPYEGDLRKRIFAIRESGATRLDELAGLGRDVTLAYAAATRELLAQMSLDPRSVAALAAHGQTLFHAPPDSIQWLDPALLAAETDLAVISDFRRADLAAGGQGAPLVPFADWILFRHPGKTRVILNIGGIANLTYLPAGGGIEDVIAFDTGPGNCLSDHIMRRYGRDGMDEGGELACAGDADSAAIVHALLQSIDFVHSPPPKSTDGPAMIAAYEQARRARLPRLHLEELTHELATAAALVARIIADAIHGLTQWPEAAVEEVYVAGGGVKNRAIMGWLRGSLDLDDPHLPASKVMPVDDLGLPSQAREAVAFAILGAATMDGGPSNVPSATGARRRVVLGSVTPRSRT